MNKQIQILNDDRGFHIYIGGYYHCTCATLVEAQKIAADRFE